MNLQSRNDCISLLFERYLRSQIVCAEDADHYNFVTLYSGSDEENNVIEVVAVRLPQDISICQFLGVHHYTYMGTCEGILARINGQEYILFDNFGPDVALLVTSDSIPYIREVFRL